MENLNGTVLISVILVGVVVALFRNFKQRVGKQNAQAPPAKKKKEEYDIVCMYGSQTGTAEGFAKILSNEAESFGLKSKVVDLEDFDQENFLDSSEKHPYYVFLMATYGEGDPTDNAVQFMNFVTDEDNSTDSDLEHVKYSVYGLGNKQYTHFNATAKKLDKSLKKRGAQRSCEIGTGDDDEDIESDFRDWKTNFWKTVAADLGVSVDISQVKQKKPGSHLKLVVHENETEANIPRDFNPNPSTNAFDAVHPFECQVLVNRELFVSDRSCRHIELTMHDDVYYETGDHLGVLPENPPALVQAIAKRLSLNTSTVVSIESLDSSISASKLPFQGKLTIGDVLGRCPDLTCTVSPQVLSSLALFATDPKQEQELNMLSSKEGQEQYSKLIGYPMLTIVEVMFRFKSVEMNLVEFLASVPRLQVRYYSICSSHMLHPRSIHICVAVVEYEKPDKRRHEGVCSKFLQKTSPSIDKLRAFVRKSSFHPPSSLLSPMLLIGPGTGIAPFIGFVQDRMCHIKNGSEIGRCDLYFGCRYKEREFLYFDELSYAATTQAITNFHTAFSRDSGEKIYVQHLLKRNSKEVWDLLKSGGYVYVCGLVAMSKDVIAVLQEIIKEEGKMSEDKANEMWEQLKNDGRFKTDVWT
eukprot:c19556_g1_i3.p1 GENE.c19556_g1_i3~~c19556_g1_i3.p1  ORF type:complete len:681 (-),score=261.81 c19556_g1_i3:9-1925(-)